MTDWRKTSPALDGISFKELPPGPERIRLKARAFAINYGAGPEALHRYGLDARAPWWRRTWERVVEWLDAPLRELRRRG